MFESLRAEQPTGFEIRNREAGRAYAQREMRKHIKKFLIVHATSIVVGCAIAYIIDKTDK